MASVPVYEEEESKQRRKVQRVTSPEKWEIKQVYEQIYTLLHKYTVYYYYYLNNKKNLYQIILKLQI